MTFLEVTFLEMTCLEVTFFYVTILGVTLLEVTSRYSDIKLYVIGHIDIISPVPRLQISWRRCRHICVSASMHGQI